jgi:hypothetical protein
VGVYVGVNVGVGVAVGVAETRGVALGVRVRVAVRVTVCDAVGVAVHGIAKVSNRSSKSARKSLSVSGRPRNDSAPRQAGNCSGSCDTMIAAVKSGAEPTRSQFASATSDDVGARVGVGVDVGVAVKVGNSVRVKRGEGVVVGGSVGVWAATAPATRQQHSVYLRWAIYDSAFPIAARIVVQNRKSQIANASHSRYST